MCPRLCNGKISFIAESRSCYHVFGFQFCSFLYSLDFVANQMLHGVIFVCNFNGRPCEANMGETSFILCSNETILALATLRTLLNSCCEIYAMKDSSEYFEVCDDPASLDQNLERIPGDALREATTISREHCRHWK